MDLYKVLEIDMGASLDAVKKAYKQLSKKYHPDLNKDDNAAKMFREVNDAYDILGDADKRKKYDSGIHVKEIVKQRNSAKIIKKEIFLPEEIFGIKTIVRGFTTGKSYCVIQELDNGDYIVVNDNNLAVKVSCMYFVAPTPGINPVFNPSVEDSKVFYDGPILRDSQYNSGSAMPRR